MYGIAEVNAITNFRVAPYLVGFLIRFPETATTMQIETRLFSAVVATFSSLFLKKSLTQSRKTTAIRIIAVWETTVSRYNIGPIEGPP